MNIGERYSLKWKHPHRIEAVITQFEQDHVVVEVDHRCPFSCYLQAMRTTLPVHGIMRYRYPEFAQLFEKMSDGIPLPPAQRT